MKEKTTLRIPFIDGEGQIASTEPLEVLLMAALSVWIEGSQISCAMSLPSLAYLLDLLALSELIPASTFTLVNSLGLAVRQDHTLLPC